MTTTVLELAISLMFFFLLVSALCSALQELLANWMNLRAKTMEGAFKQLLQNPNIADEIYNHALVKGMVKDGRKPSYLTSETFARVLLDLHQAGKLTGTAKDIVDTLAPSALTDFDERRVAVEKWFDDAMGRVSGWYKRKTHVLVWAIAIVVCLFLNADSLMLAKIFWNDQALRESMVAAAKKYVETEKSTSAEKSGGAETKPADASATGTSDKSASSNEEVFKRLGNLRSKLADTGVPIGWCKKDEKHVLHCWPTLSSEKKKDTPTPAPPPGTDSQQEDPRLFPDDTWGWLAKVLGILVTGLAVSQGSPFWFDLLSKATNVRLAGKKPNAKK